MSIFVKTFNRNASSLDVSPAMKTVIREIMETITLHGSVLQKMAEEPGALQATRGVSIIPVIPPIDEVQQLLLREVFG